MKSIMIVEHELTNIEKELKEKLLEINFEGKAE